MAVKLAVEIPPVITIEFDTVRFELLLERETTVQPDGAVRVRVTLQFATAPELRVDGLHETTAGTRALVSATGAVCETPFNAAVTVAELSAAMVPAVAVNVVNTDPAATVAEAGVVSRALLFDRVRVAPPVGAAFESAAVQVVLAPVLRVLGLQVSEVSAADDTRLMAAVWETPLSVAVMVAF